MIIGIDMGASAVKIAGLAGDEVLFTRYEMNGVATARTLLCDLLSAEGIDLSEIGCIALTGIRSGRADLAGLGRHVVKISEVEAIGEGGSRLSGGKDAVIAAVGTGTAFVLSRGGVFLHLGGTGIGGGTLCGLTGKILGFRDVALTDKLSENGRPENTDLLIGDLFPGDATLDPGLTASNLAKANRETSNEDWACGIINMILQVVGSMTMLACNGAGMRRAVITGALTKLKAAPDIFAGFEKHYGIEYVIAEHAACATAVGAAFRARAES
ncbi:MAG: hypothetical protein FWG32_03270 [Oscillospiraceae bacterium]|nr:hypothetical protein [Oscillospiraceae bacterium]